jgi:hypothetical protein
MEHQPIDGEAFAQAPLNRDEAAQAADLLWQDYASNVKATREAEHDARALTLEGKTVRYAFKIFGSKLVLEA